MGELMQGGHTPEDMKRAREHNRRVLLNSLKREMREAGPEITEAIRRRKLARISQTHRKAPTPGSC